jgi:hypothetical protein
MAAVPATAARGEGVGHRLLAEAADDLALGGVAVEGNAEDGGDREVEEADGDPDGGDRDQRQAQRLGAAQQQHPADPGEDLAPAGRSTTNTARPIAVVPRHTPSPQRSLTTATELLERVLGGPRPRGR